MTLDRNEFLQSFEPAPNKKGQLFSLPLLGERLGAPVGRLPVSLRIVLESVLRHLDGKRVPEAAVRALAAWKPNAPRTEEVPFVVARVLLQDFTGVPLVVDLAAMRSAVARQGGDPKRVEPLVPVDLVIDHSVQVDYFGAPEALRLNMEIEQRRNAERYRFLKWGMGAFSGMRVVPPGIGICHQVNLEYLAKALWEKGGVYFPDTLVGTDSHTTMVNGLGVLGWGVGGIEAEAAMLGQPVYLLTPDVVGVNLHGRLREGTTGTDLVLAVTELLRKTKVVGKLVEFHGEGARSLPVPDRATIANMAPEYGATAGLFPVDERTLEYLRATGRDEAHVVAVERYFRAQQMFGIPLAGEVDYSQVVELDLASVRPSVSGPKRPQDRIDLFEVKRAWSRLLTEVPAKDGGYGKSVEEAARRYPATYACRAEGQLVGGGLQDPSTVPDGARKNTSTLTETEMMNNRPTPDRVPPAPGALLGQCSDPLAHGDVVIAAITSCTNTSNPSVMLGAGLLAKKAVERGLKTSPHVKTSLAPGSRVVTEYLEKTGLQRYLDQLGFDTVGYGCTTCIGNSGPLDPGIEEAIAKNDLVLASVLSGNRNFEARIHQSVKANFLMSPPLVVAFALAGRIGIDFEQEPIGASTGGEPVYLRDLWPSQREVAEAYAQAVGPETYRKLYAGVERQNPMWNQIPVAPGVVYEWDAKSTYIREPPYFDPTMAATAPADVTGARALAIFGDSVTTDHISPAGAIKPTSPAGEYLRAHGVAAADFNSYGARRGNHEVMVRGTFANVRIKNRMVAPVEGGVTAHQPDGARTSIYDAAMRYAEEGVPLLIFAGQEYGTGSSRDWAAKGTRLLGVRAIVAQSFERIHRTNLVGMGVLPCQFAEGTSPQSLGLDGTERFDLLGLDGGLSPGKPLRLLVHRATGARDEVPLVLRIDTPIEVEYYLKGGMLPYVLEQLTHS